MLILSLLQTALISYDYLTSLRHVEHGTDEYWALKSKVRMWGVLQTELSSGVLCQEKKQKNVFFRKKTWSSLPPQLCHIDPLSEALSKDALRLPLILIS